MGEIRGFERRGVCECGWVGVVVVGGDGGGGGGWRMAIHICTERVKRLPSTYDYIHA